VRHGRTGRTPRPSSKVADDPTPLLACIDLAVATAAAFADERPVVLQVQHGEDQRTMNIQLRRAGRRA
jgi:hypothetical protein